MHVSCMQGDVELYRKKRNIQIYSSKLSVQCSRACCHQIKEMFDQCCKNSPVPYHVARGPINSSRDGQNNSGEAERNDEPLHGYSRASSPNGRSNGTPIHFRRRRKRSDSWRRFACNTIPFSPLQFLPTVPLPIPCSHLA